MYFIQEIQLIRIWNLLFLMISIRMWAFSLIFSGHISVGHTISQYRFWPRWNTRNYINFVTDSSKMQLQYAKKLMVPFILSWASTVNKTQGCTLDYTVIYLGSRLLPDRLMQVVLSHGRRLNGIQIELVCSNVMGRVPYYGDALDEMARLPEHN